RLGAEQSLAREELQVEGDRSARAARGDEPNGQRRSRVQWSPPERCCSGRLALLPRPDHPLGPWLNEGVAQAAGRRLEGGQEDDPVEGRRPAQDNLAAR